MCIRDRLYIVVPNRKSRIKYELPGAIFTALGWTIFSYVFSIYVAMSTGFAITYGLSLIHNSVGSDRHSSRSRYKLCINIYPASDFDSYIYIRIGTSTVISGIASRIFSPIAILIPIESSG